MIPLYRLLLTASVAVWVVSVTLRGAAGEPDNLQTEVQNLREQNAQLNQRLESQSRALDVLMQRLDNIEKKQGQTAAEKPAAPVSAPSTDTHMDMAPDMSASKLNLRWFGDVNYRAGGKNRGGSIQPATFSLGQLDLMANAQLSDRVSVMSEIVFQYRDSEAQSTTIERLQLQYHASDLFNLRLGRMHTPFGYWNETFHHGSWFQTTVLRPDLLRFHDGGSVMPIHSIGVEMYGYQPFVPLDVHYSLGVANGRGALLTDNIDAQDLNNNKALYGVLSVAPAAIPGLNVGVNAYGDVIPPDATNPARVHPMDELITGAHLTFLRNKAEFLAEAMRIEHKDKVAGTSFTTKGMYAQAAYQLNAFKPYVRFDRLEAPVGGDPYYGAALVDIKRYTGGVRWDFISWAALKLEYHYIVQAKLDYPHAAYLQATFSF